mgnify:CR=1 FL=1
MVERPTPAQVLLCLLAGGEGRRMGGQDKGLVVIQGEPLARGVLRQLAPQAQHVLISANRNAEAYQQLWRDQGCCAPSGVQPVFADDDDLPARSGPLAGMLSGLRRAAAQGHSWVQFAPCDTPRLPTDLTGRLLAAAEAAHADIAVPQTQDLPDVPRPHWVCALVHTRTLPQLTAQFQTGERKVSRWVSTHTWRSVLFEDRDAFVNFNSLEPTHASR